MVWCTVYILAKGMVYLLASNKAKVCWLSTPSFIEFLYVLDQPSFLDPFAGEPDLIGTNQGNNNGHNQGRWAHHV